MPDTIRTPATLVTGANGEMGHGLIERLSAAGGHHIKPIQIRDERRVGLAGYFDGQDERVVGGECRAVDHGRNRIVLGKAGRGHNQQRGHNRDNDAREFP